MSKIQLGPVTIKLGCGHHRVRLLPGFRDLREQTGPVFTTPHFRGPQAKEKLMAFSMTDSQQVVLTIAYTDKRGNPVPAPAGATPPTWSVDNTQLLAVTPAPDGMSCSVAAVGPLGDGTVSVKVADAGGNPLASGSFACSIIGGAPVNVAITPGVPTEQP